MPDAITHALEMGFSGIVIGVVDAVAPEPVMLCRSSTTDADAEPLGNAAGSASGCAAGSPEKQLSNSELNAEAGAEIQAAPLAQPSLSLAVLGLMDERQTGRVQGQGLGEKHDLKAASSPQAVQVHTQQVSKT